MARKIRGYTEDQAAYRSGYGRSTISKMCRLGKIPFDDSGPVRLILMTRPQLATLRPKSKTKSAPARKARSILAEPTAAIVDPVSLLEAFNAALREYLDIPIDRRSLLVKLGQKCDAAKLQRFIDL